jgi:ubiquinone/menaquinone biosynthesis C-methylase UbiE
MFTSTCRTATFEPAHELRAKAFYYARTPMLLIDVRGVLLEMNAAARLLFGADAAGAKGKPVAVLERQVGDRLQGSLIPAEGICRRQFEAPTKNGPAPESLLLDTDDLRLAVTQCRYDSQSFGATLLGVSELPYIETQSGRCSGSIVSLEIRQMTSMDAYCRQVGDRQAHDIMWEVYAASYDRILPRLKFYRQVAQRHCAAMSQSSMETILDAGAGTGIVTARLLRQGRRVTAVDTSHAMLARLRAKVPDNCADRLTVIEDTAEHMPYLDDDSFDGVTVLLSLFDMQNPEAALGETMRVLRPGGTLIITEPRACFQVEPLMQAAREQLREQGLLEQLAEDWKRIQVVAPLIKAAVLHNKSSATDQQDSIWNAEAARGILEQAGYTGLSFRSSHLGNCATICARKPA